MAIDYANDLLVEVEVPTAGVQNLVKNPDGEKGGWGWESPVTNTTVAGIGTTPNFNLRFQTLVSQATYFRTELLPVTAGQYAVARLGMTSITGSHNLKASFEWYNSSKVYLSTSTQTPAFTGGAVVIPSVLAPANTAYAKLRLDFYSGTNGLPIANAVFQAANVMVATSATSTGFVSTRTNLITNPSFETNTNGWTVRTGDGASASRVTGGMVGTYCMQVSFLGAATTTVKANNIAVTAGNYYTFVGSAKTNSGERWAMNVNWIDKDGVTIASAGLPYDFAPGSTWNTRSGVFLAPTGALNAQVELVCSVVNNSQYWQFDALLFEQSNVANSYFDGSTAATTGITNAWTGTAHASTSVQTIASSSFVYAPPYAWLPITGSVVSCAIDRQALNLGTCNVTLRNPALDPSTVNPVLKPGKVIRVKARSGTTWNQVFTGKIDNARVGYERTSAAPAVGTIQITALDAMAELTQPESRSVSTVPELAYTLEDKGVPWNLNGVTSHYAGTPVVPVINENASMADQVAMTRDSNRGWAFVSKEGVLSVFSTGQTFGSTFTLSDVAGSALSYRDPVVDWDTASVMNQIEIKHLKTNDAGDAEEVPIGVYQDAASVKSYGPQKASYTLVGNVDFAAFATAILSANATPVRRAQRVRVPIDDTATLTFAGQVDIGSRITVVFADKVNTQYRVSTLSHSIEPGAWYVDIGFDKVTSNPAPQQVNSPPNDTAANTGWIPLPLVNGWVPYSDTTNWGTPKYRRKDGVVYIQGLVTQPVPGQATFTVAVLPVGFRPNQGLMMIGTNENTPVRLDVLSTGTITLPTASSINGYASITCSFLAA